MHYYTDDDLAVALGVPKERVALWRKQYAWPHLLIGRTVRYTADQVAEIERKHTRDAPADEPRIPGALPGQTRRSALYHSRKKKD